MSGLRDLSVFADARDRIKAPQTRLEASELSSILLELDPHGLAWLKTFGLLFADVKTTAVVMVRDGESW